MAKFTKEDAKQVSILEVAEKLGMRMRRQNSWIYEWEEHDSFKIDTRKNTFFWYSQGFGGDTIKLVEEIKDVSFKEAMHFLREGEFPEHQVTEFKKQPFRYNLQEEDFSRARDYLRDERGLSDDTIDFFLSQGKLAQAQKQTDDYQEAVVVFKFKNQDGQLVGASLQGIDPNPKHSRGRLKQIMYNSDGLSGFTADIGTPKRLVMVEAPIDLMSYYELNKSRLEDVRLVSMDGLKESTISHYLMELLYKREGRELPRDIERSRLEHFWSTLSTTSTFFDNPEHQELITLAVDNDDAGRAFIERLQEKGYRFQTELPELQEGQIKVDWNDYLKEQKEGSNSQTMQENIRLAQERREQQEKQGGKTMNNSEHQEELKGFPDTSDLTPAQEEFLRKNWNNISFSVQPSKQIRIGADKTIEYQKPIPEETKKAPESSQGQEKKIETKLGDFSEDSQKAAPLPEASQSQPLNDLSPSQTRSQSLLHFTINEGGKSIHKPNYHPIKSTELRKLNRYAPQLQQAANWYLNTLADSKVSYFIKDGDEIKTVSVSFNKENFMHLTGIAPVSEAQTPEQTLLDFAEGRGTFDNIMIANRGATFEKLQVLPDFEAVIDSNSFYFDDLSQIEKFNRIDLSQAIMTEDKDLLLALRDVDGVGVPASLMRVKEKLEIELDGEEKVILGVFRERDGQIDQLSINEDYIKDGGKELYSIIQSKQFEEIVPVSAKDFTAVLDTAYNLGVLDRGQINPAYRDAWESFYERYERLGGDLAAVVKEAGEEGLLEKDSNLYKEFMSDLLYKENYHIRLKWAEEWKNGVTLPFNNTDLIDYPTFATELYRLNQLHQNQPPFTKVTFDLYAPEGELIGDNLRYEIGSETTPIVSIERFGSKQLREHPDLIAYDQELLDNSVSKEESMQKVDDLEDIEPFKEQPYLENERKEMNSTHKENSVEEKDTRTVTQLISDKDQAGLEAHIKEGMKAYLDSNQFRNFLDTMAKFPQYSLNNLELIRMQNPKATHVAGYQTWIKKFGRHVVKDQKSMKIFAPTTRKVERENEAGEMEVRKIVTGYKLVSVFDVSQTDGKELPKALNELTGDVKDYEHLYRAAKSVSLDSGVPLEFEEINRHNTKGYYHPGENRIAISKGLKGQEQILKTIFHEMAHSDLHRGSNARYGDEEYRKQEIQAEGVAYVVASHYGFDTTQYSFGYLAMWAQGENGLEEMTNQLATIQKEAKSLIERMDAKLEILKSQTKDVAKDKFTEKLEHAKLKSEEVAMQQQLADKQVDSKKSMGSPDSSI